MANSCVVRYQEHSLTTLSMGIPIAEA
jgi:hypothetical protein